jgi:phenylpyruvate tautomerase PptA (4-oxalocrotonate tautomerase family)
MDSFFFIFDASMSKMKLFYSFKSTNMPTVKIELQQGYNIESLVILRNAAMDAVIEALHLPNIDRNVRILEYKPELFQLKAPYEVLIEITLFSGRTKETKKRLYQSIVENINQRLEIKKTEVFIILNEQPLVNWGVRGGLPADEIALDFKVEI